MHNSIYNDMKPGNLTLHIRKLIEEQDTARRDRESLGVLFVQIVEEVIRNPDCPTKTASDHSAAPSDEDDHTHLSGHVAELVASED